MYQVYCNEELIYDIRSKELTLINPKVDLEDNLSGSFEFTIPPRHPYYDKLNSIVDIISVKQDGEEIFCGRILKADNDFWNRKKVQCEGELAYLLDSNQEVAEYHDLTIRGYLEKLIDIHNQQVESYKQFQVGAVTVTNSTDNVYRYSNYENTLECIKEKLVSRLGGHLVIRKVNGVRYLDYLESYGRTSKQAIEFGKNLLDFSSNTDAGDIATCLIPLGAVVEDGESIGNIEERVTIESVNNGSKRIYAEEARKIYGTITKVVTWDDVHLPSNLLKNAKEYLADVQYENMSLECKAVDLNLTNKEIERFRIGDNVQVTSGPHGLNRLFPLYKMIIPLDKPHNGQFSMGINVKRSFTERNSEQNQNIMDKIAKIPSKKSILDEAIKNATEIINRFQNDGYVIYGESEISIMDAPDPALAKNVWRWNLGGLAHSSNGYNGPFDKLALTMDGRIMGQHIAVGTVEADALSVSYKQDVEKKISEAEYGANLHTDDALKSYWTKLETETAIKNTGESVLISAKSQATEMMDSRLLSYATNNYVEVKLEEIEIAANKKYTTKDELSKYSTTTEMRGAINVAAENITLGVNESLKSYSTTKQMNAAIELESKNITLGVSESLKSYSTTKQMNTAIEMASDSITLGVSKTLESYSTTTQMNAAIKIVSDKISSKVEAGDIGTLIEQNTSSVRIAWNKSNNYIEFANSELNIYTSSATHANSTLLMKLNYTGSHFYRSGTYLGNIGTNNLNSYPNNKGLVFDLQYNAYYMAWAAMASSGASSYTLRWTYVSRSFAGYTGNRLYAGCDIDMQNYTLRNPKFEGGGISDTLTFVQPLKINSDGTVASWSNGATLKFQNGILVSGKWY